VNCAKLAIQQVCIMCPNDSKAQRAKDVPRMRICFVSPYPPRFGGIATYTHELIAGIKERGHAVYVICNPDLNARGMRNRKTFLLRWIHRKWAGIRTF
jgi:hypothetical protein